MSGIKERYLMKRMFWAIMKDIRRFYNMYSIPAAQTAAVVLVLALVAGCIYAHRRGGIDHPRRAIAVKAVLTACLADYIYIVVGITMLSRRESYSDIVNLELFSTFQKTFSGMKNVYENFILLMPCAVLLYALADVFRRVPAAFLTGFFASVAIETIQMQTHLGRFELDDILMNTAGFMVGYFLCAIVHKMASIVRNMVLYRGNC